MQSSSRHRWSVVAIFFFFMLLHQSDKLLIGSLADRIQETFHITTGTVLDSQPLCIGHAAAERHAGHLHHRLGALRDSFRPGWPPCPARYR